MTADTPDPRPVLTPDEEAILRHGRRDHRPVAPLSELTAEEAQPLTSEEIDVLRRWSMGVRAAAYGPNHNEDRLRWADDVFRLLATLDAARAAPQADEGLEGYWEKAYWEIVPKLQSAVAAAPQADEGLVEFIDSVMSVTPRRTGSSYADGVSEGIHTALIVVREKASQLAAAAPVPAGLDAREALSALYERMDKYREREAARGKPVRPAWFLELVKEVAALSQLPEDPT